MPRLKVRDLESLELGERFITIDSQRKGTLLYCSPSSATVEWDGKTTKVNGKTRWGEQFAFEKKGSKQEAISLKTKVARLRRTKR